MLGNMLSNEYVSNLSGWPVDQAVTRLSLEREVCGSNLGPGKSDTVLPTVHPCYKILKEVALPVSSLMTITRASQSRCTLWRNSTSIQKI